MIDKKNKPLKKNMTVTVGEKYYQFLKSLSYKISAEEDRKVGLSELVKVALDNCYPMPKDQMELDFSDKKEDVESEMGENKEKEVHGMLLQVFASLCSLFTLSHASNPDEYEDSLEFFTTTFREASKIQLEIGAVAEFISLRKQSGEEASE